MCECGGRGGGGGEGGEGENIFFFLKRIESVNMNEIISSVERFSST